MTFTLSQIKAMGRDCEYCGEWFLPSHTTPWQKYCTPKCRLAAVRMRQAIRESAEMDKARRTIQEWRVA